MVRHITPSHETELLDASIGDVITISYLKGDEEDFQTRLTLQCDNFHKEQFHAYAFIEQEKATTEGGIHLVKAHTTSLRTMLFDNHLGVIINNLNHGIDFFGQERGRQYFMEKTYEEMVASLKDAQLWSE